MNKNIAIQWAEELRKTPDALVATGPLEVLHSLYPNKELLNEYFWVACVWSTWAGMSQPGWDAIKYVSGKMSFIRVAEYIEEHYESL